MISSKTCLYILIFLTTFFSCQDSKKSEKNVFYYNEDAGISSLDPAFAKDQSNIWAVTQLYNGLVQLDSDLQVKPCLAKSWDISADGLTYTFYLRNDIYFHSDACFKNQPRKFNASDIVYSFKRLIAAETASPGSWIFNDKTDSNSFTAINDTVFRLTITKEFPPLLGMLSMPYAFAVAKEAIELYGKDSRAHPVGTGPFKMKAWQEGNRLVLLKNKAYFERSSEGIQLPLLDGVIVSFIESKQAAFFEFAKGKLDFVNGLESSFKDEILSKAGRLKSKYQSQFNLVVGPYLNTEYLAILVDDTSKIYINSPFKNIKFRKAIYHAIDRKKMITYLRNGIGNTDVVGFVPTDLLSNGDQYLDLYQPELSKKLINEIGVQKEAIKLYTNKSYLDLTIYIQHELEAVGIKSTIEVNPGSAHRDMVSKSQLSFFRGSWIADYPDAENYLSLFYSKNFCPNGPNNTHFKSAIYDELYEQSMKTVDVNKRKELYTKMNNLVTDYYAVIPLFYDQSIRLVQKNIKGLETNPLNLLVLKYVTKAKED